MVIAKCKWKLVQAGGGRAFKMSARISYETVQFETIGPYWDERQMERRGCLGNYFFLQSWRARPKVFFTIWRGPEFGLGTRERTGRACTLGSSWVGLVMLFSGSSGRMFWVSPDRVSACDITQIYFCPLWRWQLPTNQLSPYFPWLR